VDPRHDRSVSGRPAACLICTLVSDE
jgi:hypothetical protein